MSGAGAVGQLVLSLGGPEARLPLPLRPGQSLAGIVVKTPEGLAVEAGGTRLKLPAGAMFQAGQQVNVSLASEAGAVQIKAQSTRVGPGPTTNLASGLGLVEAVVKALGVANPPPTAVTGHVLPVGIPLTEEAVRVLLSLFTMRGTVARDLTTLSSMIKQAVSSGALASNVGGGIAALMERFSIKEGDHLEKALQRIGRAMGKPIEGSLTALKGGGSQGLAGAMREDIRAQLLFLKSHEPFQRFLLESGQGPAFSRAVEGVLDRLNGVLLHNLHGLEQPYYFLELPVDPESGLGFAQMHIFGEGGTADERFGAKASMVVLDLEMNRLGPLWIGLRTTPGGCECTLRATTASVKEALDAALHELQAGLEAAGYGPARIETALWDGNRLEAAAELMRGFSGLDLSV